MTIRKIVIRFCRNIRKFLNEINKRGGWNFPKLVSITSRLSERWEYVCTIRLFEKNFNVPVSIKFMLDLISGLLMTIKAKILPIIPHIPTRQISTPSTTKVNLLRASEKMKVKKGVWKLFNKELEDYIPRSSSPR